MFAPFCPSNSALQCFASKRYADQVYSFEGTPTAIFALLKARLFVSHSIELARKRLIVARASDGSRSSGTPIDIDHRFGGPT